MQVASGQQGDKNKRLSLPTEHVKFKKGNGCLERDMLGNPPIVISRNALNQEYYVYYIVKRYVQTVTYYSRRKKKKLCHILYIYIYTHTMIQHAAKSQVHNHVLLLPIFHNFYGQRIRLVSVSLLSIMDINKKSSRNCQCQ